MSGKLTAEQVREAVYANSIHADCADADWHAIADTLNVQVERTCHVELNESRTAVICSNCGSIDLLKEWSTFKGWDGETRVDEFTTYSYCPNCGAKIWKAMKR